MPHPAHPTPIHGMVGALGGLFFVFQDLVGGQSHSSREALLTVCGSDRTGETEHPWPQNTRKDGKAVLLALKLPQWLPYPRRKPRSLNTGHRSCTIGFCFPLLTRLCLSLEHTVILLTFRLWAWNVLPLVWLT